MLAIFSDMVEDYLKVFMDDFSVSGDTFDTCLGNLAKVLKRCEESDLVLNWEKCHFMVTEGTILGHKISSQGIRVDKAKVEVIEKLPPPTTVKGIRSFLGHAGFYRRFIKDFSKISKPLCNLLQQNQPFAFDEDCHSTFKELKKKLISAPIVVPPDWTSPFELMCDANDYAVGAALGQRRGKLFHVIYYASRTLNDAQVNYTTTKKELLAVVFAFDKFRSYLIEFNLEKRDRKGTENQIADHLSRLENKSDCESNIEIKENFPDEKILSATAIPWEERNSDMMLDIIFGMSHICSINVQISCNGDVSPRKNKKTFYFIATHRHVEGILEGLGLLQRSYNLVFIGPHYSRMPTISTRHVIDVNRPRTSLEGMKCHCNTYLLRV
ncbi:hypothetical protein V6N11_080375 [Hibiscus sabdariffa]|uniref:Reverse transcriptase/retrotransposon-derived protein RNase H-like domain-containing protein n=1 Tax=Hibiscus sabdariffa TaxID=183260 RepID=A0ABR2R7G5_9ROSI